MEKIYPVTVVRELPAITDRLPSLAFSTVGGGEILMDPSDPENLKALAKVLQLELRFKTPVRIPAMGGRTYARFDHGEEPLAWRIYRNLRQLFLSRFHV
jgi:putative peptide zinc metalloprotease protein